MGSRLCSALDTFQNYGHNVHPNWKKKELFFLIIYFRDIITRPPWGYKADNKLGYLCLRRKEKSYNLNFLLFFFFFEDAMRVFNICIHIYTQICQFPFLFPPNPMECLSPNKPPFCFPTLLIHVKST